jgi:molybdopterin-containing oxidoreductase family membrane subunit
VVVGQIVPQFHEYGVIDLPAYYPYVPSLHEIMVTLGGIGLCVMGFLMGERLFKGHLSEDH